MAYKDTAKKTAYQNKFIKNTYDRINLTVPKGRKEEIATAAAASGESVNAYINRAITAQMQRETAARHPAGEGGVIDSTGAVSISASQHEFNSPQSCPFSHTGVPSPDIDLDEGDGDFPF